MSTNCSLSRGIKYHVNVDFDGKQAVPAGLFFADGCLCLVFAIFTHFKYTSVSVLNHSFHTKAMSNVSWIWFFIFTAISSIMNGLNWLNLHEIKNKEYPFIVGWITHLLGVLSLAYAIKYQWKYREEAYHDMSYDSERTPVLFHRAVSKKPSSADVLFFVIFCISLGLFIAGINTNHSDSYYWISFSFAWLIRIAIFILVFVIHYKFSVEGPSIFIKCLLLAGVLFNTPCDIPSYIWLKCILAKNKDAKVPLFDTLIGLVLLSHVVFFFALRSEFLRLRDITRWHIADRLEDIEEENKRFRDS